MNKIISSLVQQRDALDKEIKKKETEFNKNFMTSDSKQDASYANKIRSLKEIYTELQNIITALIDFVS